MQIKALLRKISHLILISEEGSKDWVRSSRMRGAWNRLLVALFATMALNLAVNTTPLAKLLSALRGGAFAFRIAMALSVLIALAFLCLLLAHYARVTLEGRRKIWFANVVVFYVFWTTLFALLYYFLFLAAPNFFSVDSDLVQWNANLNLSTTWSAKMHFMLFSALDSMGISYPPIDVGVEVAIVRYLQRLYSFSLIALLIAGYVNQHAVLNQKD